MNFLRCIPQCTNYFRIFMIGHGEPNVSGGCNWSAPYGTLRAFATELEVSLLRMALTLWEKKRIMGS